MTRVSDAERGRRWRLVLGGVVDDESGGRSQSPVTSAPLSADDQPLDGALADMGEQWRDGH